MARSGLGLGFTSAGLVWLVGSAIFTGSTCGFSGSVLADLSALVSSGVRGISGDADGGELNNILGVISANESARKKFRTRKQIVKFLRT